MADLEALIRLRRHTVEEKQKFLADLFRKAEVLEDRKRDLQERLKKERAVLEENPELETITFYGPFESAMKQDIERLTEGIKKWDVRIQIAQDDVRNAFAELKRVEIVDRRRKKEAAAKQKTKEAMELDEIGIEGYRRREKF